MVKASKDEEILWQTRIKLRVDKVSFRSVVYLYTHYSLQRISMLFLIANKLTYHTETTGMHGERNIRNESEGCPIDKYRLGHSY